MVYAAQRVSHCRHSRRATSLSPTPVLSEVGYYFVGNVKCNKAGWYLLVVDRDKHTFKAYTPKVYLMGETSADGWGDRTAADLFSTPDNRNGYFVSPALKNDNAVRIYVEIPETDWWKAEFGVAANKSIQYRGNSGSDGASFTSGAGKKVYLNFSTETGDIK